MSFSGKEGPRIPFQLILVFLLVLAGIVATGIWSALDRCATLYGKAANELSSIADLKAAQIERWLNERMDDGLALQSGPVARDDVPLFAAGAGGAALKQRIEEWLKSIRSSYRDYDGVYMLKDDNSLLLSDVEEGISISPEDLSHAVSLSEGKGADPVLTDLHTDGGRPHMGMIVPLGAAPGRAVPARLLVWIDPEEYLFSLIQRWPVPSASGETLLVRRDGDDVLFLNELRHRKDTALKLRLPVSEEELPAAMAAKGAEGLVSGRDYRGRPVMAVIKPIEGTNWRLLAKLDDSEILAPLWSALPFIVGMTLALTLVAALGTTLIWRWREAEQFRELYEEERRRVELELTLKESEERFRLIFENVADAVFVHELHEGMPGRFVDVNSRACRLLGYTRQEMLLLSVLDIDVPEQVPRLPAIMATLFKEGAVHFETEHLAKGNNRISVEVSASTFELNGRRMVLSVARDVTERKRAEEALKESEEKYRRVVETALEAVWFLDKNFVTIDINASAVRMLGYGREELVGKPFMDLVVEEDRSSQAQEFERRRMGESGNYERRVRCKDGSVKWLYLSARAILDDAGEFNGAIGLITDITDRKNAEAELQESERALRDMVGNLPGFVYRCANDRDWTMTYISDGCRDVTGYPPEALLGNRELSYNDVVMPDHRQRLWDKWQALLDSGGVFEDEYTIKAKDGSVRWVWERGRGVFADDGRLLYLEGFITDVTARKVAEERMRLFTSVVEQASEGIAVLDNSRRVVFANRVFASMHGFEPGELLGCDISVFHSPSHMPAVIRANEIIEKVGEWQGEVWHLRKDGTEFLSLMHNALLKDEGGRVVGIVGTMVDITDRKLAESRLKESEEKFRRLAEHIPDIIVRFDRQLRHLYVSPSIERFTGIPAEKFVGKTNEEMGMPVENVAAWNEQFNMVFETMKPRTFEFSYRRGEDVRTFSATFAPEMGDDGSAATILGITHDITERKRLEDALEKERRQLLAIFDSIDEIVYVADPRTYEVLYANRCLRDKLGKNPIGGLCYREFQGFSSPCPFCTNDIILNNGGKPHTWEYRNPVIERDYRLVDRVIEWSDGREVRFEMALDITDRKRAEEELLSYSKNLEQMVEERTSELDRVRADLFSQAKLSAMGRMGAGLAHQLNSPLGGAMLLVDGLIDSCGKGAGHEEKLRMIRRALDNMHNVIECMLTLSMMPRRGGVSRMRADLSAALGTILDLSGHDCTEKGIVQVRNLAKKLPKIEARPGELDQVFLNLINNAIDAMPQGGKLTVESRADGDVVEVRVSDTGEGIPKDHIDKIFEPFFTTRRSRRGVGLGLAVVNDIVGRYGGTIEVESVVGVGTTFVVRIPVGGVGDEETPSEK